ncbi:type II toxin-antitoxin system PemK/MazF family toxin [Micromonospora krabiensis]|uniref:PemK-like, MazF-like toxin of type II toxin-antitoxin system n=1 Tax=Micromonospora krabiensis TaxID=307121 RepID=A0A1C3N4F3_9ACTN|nr:type II toxin-antitoxin system PemK/MazF family toxin [Micromonospora krabiensis]SBV27469.1 PemK-like, MazF-like toxin of type II toxin-antitoxin system [Micromonospora krabiensis]
MPEWAVWAVWAVAIVLAVAAGWLWQERRQRAGRRDRTADRASDRGSRRGRGSGRTVDEGAGRAPGGTATAPRPRTADDVPAGSPQPGEIWWADVPYADGSGSKVRPCLVLRAGGRGADVLKITSQDKSGRDDHVPIPTRDWDPGAEHDSYLDLSEPIRVPRTAFQDRAGECDATLWRRLRALPHLPT